MMMERTILIWVLLVVAPLSTWKQVDGVEFANGVPFAMPLADGETGTALIMDGTRLVLAAPGQPPALAIFEVLPVEPSPPPNPVPPQPEPPAPVPPGPGVLDLLWIEETAARTPEQARAITNRALREALAAAGWSLRVVDQDITDETGKTPRELAAAMAAAKQAGLPYLIARSRDGAEVYAGKAPTDLVGFQTLLQRLGLRTDGQAKHYQDQVPAGTEEQAAEKAPPQGDKKDCPSGQCPTRTSIFRRR